MSVLARNRGTLPSDLKCFSRRNLSMRSSSFLPPLTSLDFTASVTMWWGRISHGQTYLVVGLMVVWLGQRKILWQVQILLSSSLKIVLLRPLDPSEDQFIPASCRGNRPSLLSVCLDKVILVFHESDEHLGEGWRTESLWPQVVYWL